MGTKTLHKMERGIVGVAEMVKRTFLGFFPLSPPESQDDRRDRGLGRGDRLIIQRRVGERLGRMSACSVGGEISNSLSFVCL